MNRISKTMMRLSAQSEGLTILFRLGIGMLPRAYSVLALGSVLYDFIEHLPAAAQGLVERDQGSGGIGLAPGEAVLGLEQGALGIEHREKIGRAFLEALFCQPSCLFACFGRGPEAVKLLASSVMLPTKVTRGKRSAVATPMRAVAAAKLRSATLISGRRRRRSCGRPRVTSIEPGIVELTIAIRTAKALQGRFALLFIRIGSVRCDGRVAIEGGFVPQGPGLAQPCNGDAQIRVAGHRQIHQPFELLILKSLPPAGVCRIRRQTRLVGVGKAGG